MVNATEGVAEVCDSDGDLITYEGTVFAIFEFISSLIESGKLQKILVPILPELMYYITAHLQITEEQVSWLSNSTVAFTTVSCFYLFFTLWGDGGVGGDAGTHLAERREPVCQ